jgi:uncharacterized protein (DUF3084 family)
MEETATANVAIGYGTLILALLGTGTVSGLVGAVAGYLLYRRKHNAEASKAEADADKTEAEAEKTRIGNAAESLDLEERVHQIATKAAKHEAELERERAAHERDNQNNEFLIRLKSEQVEDLKKDLAELRPKFYQMQGSLTGLLASEKQCQEKLASLEQFQLEQLEKNKTLTEYADRAAQLTSLIRKAHKQGFLQSNELNAAGIKKS